MPGSVRTLRSAGPALISGLTVSCAHPYILIYIYAIDPSDADNQEVSLNVEIRLFSTAQPRLSPPVSWLRYFHLK